EGILLTAEGVDTPSTRARVEPGKQRLALRWAEGVMAVVEQNGGGRGLVVFVFSFFVRFRFLGVAIVARPHVPDSSGFGAIDPLRPGAKKLEKIQEEGLAGL